MYLFCNATLCCFLKESVRHARDVEANFSSERTPSHTTDWCHYFLLWRKGFLRTLKPNAKYCHEVCTYKLTTKCFSGKKSQSILLSTLIQPSCIVPRPSAPVCFLCSFSHVSLPASDRPGSYTSLFLSTANWLTLRASCITTHHHSLANMPSAIDVIYQWLRPLKLPCFSSLKV